MKRQEISKAVRKTEKGTLNGRSIIFNYEQEEGKDVRRCDFSIFADENSTQQSCSGQISLEQNFANLHFSKPAQAGDLGVLARVIEEVELIFNLQEEATDEASAGK